MPLAAPLPFAELAGITIAGLGAAAIAKKVSDFIKLNPEDSMMITNFNNVSSRWCRT
jgi:hypothetical protein